MKPINSTDKIQWIFTKTTKCFNTLLKCPLKAFLLGLCLIKPTLGLSEDTRKQVTIGVVQIVDHPALNETMRGIEFTLKEALDTSVTIIAKKAQGNVVNAMMAARKFASQDVDVIIAIGTVAAQAAKTAVKGTNIPVVFSSVSDPEGSGLVKTNEAPGGQVTGVSNLTPQKPQLEYFQSLWPRLQQSTEPKKLGMIYNPGESNSLSMVEKTQNAAKDVGITIVTASVTKTHEVSLAARKLISQGVEAIFINNDNTSLAAFDVITTIAASEKIPVFVSDIDYVNRRSPTDSKTNLHKETSPDAIGALAALGPDQFSIGQQTAEMALLILDGKPVSTYAVRFPEKLVKVIDPKVAKSLGVTKTHYAE